MAGPLFDPPRKKAPHELSLLIESFIKKVYLEEN